jgi:hypothetical protein
MKPSDQARILEDIRRMIEPIVKRNQEVLKAATSAARLNSSFASIVAANERTTALLQESLNGQAWRMDLEWMHKSWIEQFTAIVPPFEEVQTAVCTELSSIAKSFEVSGSLAQAVNARNWNGLGGMSTILKQLQIEEASLAVSLKSFVDSVVLPKDFLGLPRSSVSGASREVFTSEHAIGTLFPTVLEDVPSGLVEEVRGARDETSDLETLIASVDPELVPMFRGSIEALESSLSDSDRHFLISIRELWTHVLHKLAPTKDVLSWMDPNDNSLLHNGRPTRRARSLYICRSVGNGGLKCFVERDTDAMVELFDVFNEVHAVKSKLTSPQLNAFALRARSYMTYIINLWTETR